MLNLCQIYGVVNEGTINVSSRYSSVPLREGHVVHPSLDTWNTNSCDCGRCVFVSSQVDFLLLLTPTSSSLCPLYVLLGRCSVILSRAGCLYDPRTEIWLARPECLSFFPFTPSLPPRPLLLCSGLHCHRSSLRLLPPLHPAQWWYKFKNSPAWHFSMLNLAYPSSLLFFFSLCVCVRFISGYPAIVSAKYGVLSDECRKGYSQ